MSATATKDGRHDTRAWLAFARGVRGRSRGLSAFGESGGPSQVGERDPYADERRAAPTVLYGLLTAADVAELARRNRKVGRRWPLPMACDC